MARYKFDTSPLPASEKRSKSIDLYMPAQLDTVVRSICAYNRLPISGFICDLLKERIEELTGDTLEGIARSMAEGDAIVVERSSDTAARTLQQLAQQRSQPAQ